MQAKTIQILKVINRIIDNVIVRYRMLFIVGSHLLLVLIANSVSFLFRFEGDIPQNYLDVGIQLVPILLVTYMGSLWLFGLFHGFWRYVGFHDLVRIGWACFVGTIFFYVISHTVLQAAEYPRSIIILTGILGAGFLGGIRLTFRWFREWIEIVGMSGKRVLLVGAGKAGELLVRDLQCNSFYNYSPVAFVDDDAKKQKIKIHGIPVVGELKDIPLVSEKYKIQEIIVTIPSASPQIRQKILFACETCPIPLKTLPNVQQLLDSPVSFQGVHNFTLEDLLEREPVRTELEELKPLLHQKRVLVTGAGGSIGSELCRQIARHAPSLLVLYERHENSLYALDLELRESFPHLEIATVVGDVTLRGQLEGVFASHSPELVIHAAAHKHVPLMEGNSIEAVRNNILGTRMVCEAVLANDVERFVLISTDKAVNPTSVMGATKWVAECLVQEYNQRSSCRFTAVRFGNVLGSNGSVVPLFTQQIHRGGPVTVTHPDMKRYFMTIPEAVQLCLQASSMGQGGDIFVLDMGEQIHVTNLARNMIRLSGLVPNRDIMIVYTGLRPGEKLYEELFAEREEVELTQHPKIRRMTTTPIFQSGQVSQHLDELENIICYGNPVQVIKKLQEIVPGYSPVLVECN